MHPTTLSPISLYHLGFALIPVIIVITIFYVWSLDYKKAIYAVLRMLLQLLLIGYFLNYLFSSNNAMIMLVLLSLMLTIASWISLHSLAYHKAYIYPRVVIAIAIGSSFTLLLITQGVLDYTPWYNPYYLIPLASIIIANAMNAVSLAIERFNVEYDRQHNYLQARRIALSASLIPVINTLFAVGLVSLPGMMTGQILSGIPPLIAARYQIMVMCMVFGAAGIASACILLLLKDLPSHPKEL